MSSNATGAFGCSASSASSSAWLSLPPDHLVVGDRLADLPADALRELARFVLALARIDADCVDGHG